MPADRNRLTRHLASASVAVAVAFAAGVLLAQTPSQFRVIGLFAAIVGGLVGIATANFAPSGDGTTRGGVACLAILAAVVAVSTYAGSSIRQFEAAEAPTTDEGRAAAMMLREMGGDSISGIPIRPSTRWLRWRLKSIHVFESPWPTIIGLAEAALCVIIAGVTAYNMREHNTALHVDTHASHTDGNSDETIP